MTFRLMGGLLVLVACSDSDNNLPPPHDVQATWRVRCEAPNEACDYPVRSIEGTIGPDDPDHLHVDCRAADGALDVSFGKASITDPSGTTPGYNLSFDVGYSPSTGFDLSRCAVLLGEDNDRLWGGSCGPDAPSPSIPCQLDTPTIVGGSLAVALHCIALPSIPFQAGRDANLASGPNPALPILLQISPCDLQP